jgi:hypothetical protein
MQDFNPNRILSKIGVCFAQEKKSIFRPPAFMNLRCCPKADKLNGGVKTSSKV